MNQSAQRTAVDNQPRDESAELRRREEVDFEHSHGVWADGPVEEAVDAQLWDWGRISISMVVIICVGSCRTLASNAFP